MSKSYVIFSAFDVPDKRLARRKLKLGLTVLRNHDGYLVNISDNAAFGRFFRNEYGHKYAGCGMAHHRVPPGIFDTVSTYSGSFMEPETMEVSNNVCVASNIV
jgi:hypothetical protein